MIDNLYRNATTKIKWKGEFSEGFTIEQGVRQGGTLSADLYKIYVNHLLDILDCAGVGAKIGSIKCSAPTCADDIALTGSNPQDIQTMINIAYDFSQREGYSLQPTKSVILPVKTSNKISHEDETWTMNNNAMPIVDQTAHIGIQRHFKDSSTATIEENLKKSRRALYSLMRSGLHGENGLDPVTSISILRTYVIPIMFYGLETLLPSGKSFETLEKQYNKMIKQILSLPINTAEPTIYIISGLLPAEAEVHKRAITLFGCICRSGKTSTEWKIAERQLSIKNSKSKSWFIDIKRLFIKYGIGDPYEFLDTILSKHQWKSLIKSKIHSYWISTISEVCNLYSSLKYLKGSYKIGQCHPLATTISANMRDIIRIPIRLKIATGTYILQANRASFNGSQLNPICLLCRNSAETLEHFLLTCNCLDSIRAPLVRDN
jgi:hypothetical protein